MGGFRGDGRRRQHRIPRAVDPASNGSVLAIPQVRDGQGRAMKRLDPKDKLASGMADANEEPLAGNYFVAAYPPFSMWEESHAPALRDVLQEPTLAGTALGQSLAGQMGFGGTTRHGSSALMRR